MPYLDDEDLSFLGEIDSDDLDDLVRFLVHDHLGSPRATESLTSSEEYIRFHPEHQKYWQLIAAEIQRFGANSISTFFRQGAGVHYREILFDVCDKLDVVVDEKLSTRAIEDFLLTHVLDVALEDMTDEEVRTIAESIHLENIDFINRTSTIAAIQAIIHSTSFQSYYYIVMVVNALMKALVGRGLTYSAGLALSKSLALLTGPVGWTMTGLWTAIDLAGPAYRVTIPIVIQIAVMRQRWLSETNLE